MSSTLHTTDKNTFSLTTFNFPDSQVGGHARTHKINAFTYNCVLKNIYSLQTTLTHPVSEEACHFHSLPRYFYVDGVDVIFLLLMALTRNIVSIKLTVQILYKSCYGRKVSLSTLTKLLTYILTLLWTAVLHTQHLPKALLAKIVDVGFTDQMSCHPTRKVLLC